MGNTGSVTSNSTKSEENLDCLYDSEGDLSLEDDNYSCYFDIAHPKLMEKKVNLRSKVKVPPLSLNSLSSPRNNNPVSSAFKQNGQTICCSLDLDDDQ